MSKEGDGAIGDPTRGNAIAEPRDYLTSHYVGDLLCHS